MGSWRARAPNQAKNLAEPNPSWGFYRSVPSSSTTWHDLIPSAVQHSLTRSKTALNWCYQGATLYRRHVSASHIPPLRASTILYHEASICLHPPQPVSNRPQPRFDGCLCTAKSSACELRFTFQQQYVLARVPLVLHIMRSCAPQLPCTLHPASRMPTSHPCFTLHPASPRPPTSSAFCTRTYPPTPCTARYTILHKCLRFVTS